MIKAVFLVLLSVSRPCEFEDSRNCYWNASEQGNGIGQSFINIDDVVVYTDWGTFPANKRSTTP